MLTKVKSITFDNDLENSRLNLLNIKWYATSAYSSWQKGIIEQKHKQLRKFIPKGKSLNKLNQEMCDLISLLIYKILLNINWDILSINKSLKNIMN